MSKPKKPDSNQGTFLFPDLIDQLNPKHPLLQLSEQIDWSFLEVEFSPLYSHLGKPNKHIRLMVGLSILKHMKNLSDEVLVQRGVQNPYYQVFTGEAEFQWALPCIKKKQTKTRCASILPYRKRTSPLPRMQNSIVRSTVISLNLREKKTSAWPAPMKKK